MSGHTKEPWMLHGCKTEIASPSDQRNDGFVIAICDGSDKKENARRIIACVNAFADFHDTEIIEDMLAGGFSVRGLSQYAKGLEQQRDELMDAAKNVSQYVVGELPHSGYLRDNDTTRCALHRLKEAVEKLESK